MNTYQRPMGNKVSAYANTNVETADRGQLLLFIYDHCIKWCKLAKEAIKDNNIEARTKAIFKVQDGLTELICALDFEKGGEIAKNLNRLYEFYNHHLSQANISNSEKNIDDVQVMMQGLRESWEQCISKVRANNSVNLRLNQQSYVSLLG